MADVELSWAPARPDFADLAVVAEELGYSRVHAMLPRIYAVFR